MLFVLSPPSTSLLGSLSTRVFETRTATGSEDFTCKDRIVSKIFIPLISNDEKILRNVNMVVLGQVKIENSSLPVAVRVPKTRALKLPSDGSPLTRRWCDLPGGCHIQGCHGYLHALLEAHILAHGFHPCTGPQMIPKRIV